MIKPPQSSRRERAFAVCVVIAIGLIIAIGVRIQSGVLLNHDVGWVIHSARWLLEGGRFGVDIIEPNPPLIWYVSLPAAALAKWHVLSEAGAIRLLTWLVCLASLAISYRVLEPLRVAGKVIDAHLLLVALALGLCILPNGNFAQREHLTVALAFPYCLLAAMRLEYGTAPSVWFAAAIGVLAGIGFAFKPYLLAVPLLVEVVVVVSNRRLKSAFRPETWAMGITGLGYAISIPLLNPEYMKTVVPLIRSIYWAFESLPLATLHKRLALACEPAIAAVVLLFLSRSATRLHVVTGAAILGFAFSFWIQFKGYEYHRYPVVVCSLLLLCLAVPSAIRGIMALSTSLPRWCVRALQLSVAGIGISYFSQAIGTDTRHWYESSNIRHGATGRMRTDLIKFVRHLSGGQSVYLYAFSTHPFPGFPTANYADVKWASRTNSQFVMPAWVRRTDRKVPASLPGLDKAVQWQREVVLEDFLLHKPHIVLLDAASVRHAIGGRKFDDMAFYTEDPRFAEVWRAYSEVAKPLPLQRLPIRIFVRKPAPDSP
jgi:hypothetical protein